jgi:hypothetical protein
MCCSSTEEFCMAFKEILVYFFHVLRIIGFEFFLLMSAFRKLVPFKTGFT